MYPSDGTSGPVRPSQVVYGAAQRLLGHMTAIRDAHDTHGIGPGPHDDMCSAEYVAQSSEIYRMTLDDTYLRQLGLTFGAVTVLLDHLEAKWPQDTDQSQWTAVRSYFESEARQFAPGFETDLGELASLGLATNPSPPVVRFDLLAELASRAAVLRMVDAASWVAELSRDMADDDLEIDLLLVAVSRG